MKTDQVDAQTLAQLLRLDYIPEAFIYPRELRPTRDLLRRRHFHRLVKKKRKRILAKAILAHKLAVAAFYVLREEQSYRPGALAA